MTMYAETFQNLSGGMNLRTAPGSLRAGESPFLQNLSWYDGALCCRPGQVALGQMLPGAVCCAPTLCHGWFVAHVGRQLRAIKLRPESDTERAACTERIVLWAADFPETPGVFLPYRDSLLYKTRGAYARITWDPETDTLRGTLLRDTRDATNAYVPVIQINTDPETGAGDLYQPENRLCGDKIVRFTPRDGVREYHLPVQGIDFVRSVTVSGGAVTDYTADPLTGVVRFAAAPAGGENAVEIRYRKENPALFRSVMDCAAATVFGGGQGLCVVVGGSAAQPNAWLWSGHSSAAMDPTYFPESQYNLAGDASDPITAFACQQDMLVIFQAEGLGRASFSLAEVSGRAQIAMNYARISDAMGCDLPGSVRLVENHLVWCSRRYGVCRLESSSAALENEVRILSRKLHGDSPQSLLRRLQRAETDQVRSADTGRKYLLVLGQDAYEWNYEISDCSDPAWFYHRGIRGVGFAVSGDELYEVTASGVVAAFRRCCMDFDEPIEKILTLPTRTLGGADRQTTVKSVLFTTRTEGSCNTEIVYTCESLRRRDPTNLVSGSWRLWPRDLSRRSLGCQSFERTFRRHPGFHNIRHLGIRLSNNEAGMDLSLVSAQILYTLRGRVR